MSMRMDRFGSNTLSLGRKSVSVAFVFEEAPEPVSNSVSPASGSVVGESDASKK